MKKKNMLTEKWNRLAFAGKGTVINESYDLESIRNSHEMSKSPAWMQGWDDAVYNHKTDFEDDAYDPVQFGPTRERDEYTQGYTQGEEDYEDVYDL